MITNRKGYMIIDEYFKNHEKKSHCDECKWLQNLTKMKADCNKCPIYVRSDSCEK